MVNSIRLGLSYRDKQPLLSLSKRQGPDALLSRENRTDTEQAPGDLIGGTDLGPCAKGYQPKADGARTSANHLQAFLTSFITQQGFEELCTRLSAEDAKRLMSSLEGGGALFRGIPFRGRGRTPADCSRFERRHNATSGQRFRIALLLHCGAPLGCGTARHSGPNAKHDRHHPTGPLWGSKALMCNTCEKPLDALGHHCCVVCGAESAKSAVHNAIEKTVHEFATEARMKARRQVASGLGRDGAPHYKDSDVRFQDGPNGKPYGIDIKTYGTHSGNTCIGKSGRDIIAAPSGAPSVRWKYADDRERETFRAAEERNAANNHDFSPFISDCFGGLHLTARIHLDWMAKVNSRAGFWEGKQHQLYRSYCKRLAVATADALWSEECQP